MPRTPHLPVLMYHGVHDGPASRGNYEPTYSVTPEQFGAQLDWLAANGFSPVRLGRRGDVARPVVLTFDDGDVSNVEVVLPMLRERGLAAEFFVPSGHVGRPGVMTTEDVRALVDAGMGVQSHGHTHAHLADLPPAAMREEIASSKALLERWSGRPVDAISLPGGRGGLREKRTAQELGYRWVLNSLPGPNRYRRPRGFLHRTVITRTTAIDEYADLLWWRGLAPRRAVARTTALEVPKRALGNARYERVRGRLRAGRS